MKKASKLLSVVSLLLVLLMAFAACAQTPEVEERVPAPTAPKAEDVTTVTPAENNYTDAIGQWMQYINFVEKEETSKVLESAVLVDGTLYDEVTPYGKWILTADHSKAKEHFDWQSDEDEDLVVSVRTKYELISALTGSKKSFKAFVPEKLDDKCLSAEYTPADYLNYSIGDIFCGNVIEIIELKYELKTYYDEEYVIDETSFGDYDPVYSYSYYLADGTAIAEKLADKALARIPTNENGYIYPIGWFLLDVNNETLLINADGEIVKTFDLGYEYDIPVFENNGMIGEIAFLETDEYIYAVTEAEPFTQQIGEMAMYTVPGIQITIMDKEFSVVSSYSSDCYHVSGYAVLDDGSIYICEYELLPASAETYDFERVDTKFDIKHYIVKPGEKTATEIDLSFAVKTLFNNNTKELPTFTNTVTLNSGFLNSCEVKNSKDGYMLAEINKYYEGVYDAKTVFAVLDRQMNIVAELPAVMPSQIGYPSFVDEDTMLINTVAKNEKVVNYIIDTATGESRLYGHNYTEIIDIEGGYLFGDVVYDNAWNKVCDFEEKGYSIETIIDGKIYFVDDNADYILYVGYVTDKYSTEEYGNVDSNVCVFEYSEICYDFDHMTDDYIVTHADVYDGWSSDSWAYLDINGKELLRGNSYSEGSYGYTSKSVLSVTEIDENMYLVAVRVTHRDYYDSENDYSYTTFYTFNVEKE